MLPEWEIWLDMQFSPVIAIWMSEETGWKVKSSYILEFNFLTDEAIYQKAKSSGNIIIISKDTDFSDLVNRLGSPPKLVQVNIGNCDNKTLWNILKNQIQKAVEILTTSDVNIVEIE